MTKSQQSFSEQLVRASADQALSALAEAGASAPALVDAWVSAGNAAAVQAAAESPAAPVRKNARRGLNVLKSRGISVPSLARVARPTKTEQKRVWEAWLMAPDAAGTVAIIIATRQQAGRYRACFCFARDNVGIFRIETTEFSASALRVAMDRLIPGAGYKPVKVPVDWARARIEACRLAHARNKTPEPLGLIRASDLLHPLPSEAPSHPFDDEGLELALEDALELAQVSAKLHLLPEFRSWFPEKRAIDEMLLEIGRNLTPGQDPDQAEFTNTLNQKVLEATDRYFSPQRRELLLLDMKDAALSVLAREGEQAALEVVAAMRTIEARGLITDPPSELPFLRAFFQKALSLLAARDGGALRIPIPGAGQVELPDGDALLGEVPADPAAASAALATEAVSADRAAALATDSATPEKQDGGPDAAAELDNDW